MTLLEIGGIIGGAIMVLFAALSGFFAWRNGAPQISSDVITTYKSRIDQLDERVKICENLHRENLGEIGRLKGINEEKDKRIAILETVDLKKNPELLEFMKQTTEALVSVKEFFNDLKDGTFTVSKKV